MKRWCPVRNYEDLYEVSDQGEVRRNGRILKPSKGQGGYLGVSLSKNGIIKRHRVHRLVAVAFVSNLMYKPQVNHVNGIPSDNRSENLEWVTQSENQTHAILNGLQPATNSPTQMSTKTKDNIRSLSAEGISSRKLAVRFKTNQTNILNIINRKHEYS